MMKTTTILIGGVVLGGIVLSTSMPVAAATAKAKPVPAARADPVEARIAKLHGDLHITAAQEPQWTPVAEMIRTNSKAMADVRKQKIEDPKDRSAVDELKAYAAVIDTHADGVHKLVPVFQPLYDGMSEAQKKTADVVFHRNHAAERSK